MDSESFLIRGNDYLARTPNFKFVARDDVFKKMCRILMRVKASSILLVGPGGVGCTALCMALEACKQIPDTPFDIINKRIFWLDTNGFFSTGDPKILNENFQKMVRRLSRYPDTILIIEDMRDFIEAARNNGCTNFINALMHAVEKGKFQAIFECRDDALELILKCHSNIGEFFTLLDMQEPDTEALKIIIAEDARRMEKYHHIPVDDSAIQTAIQLTTKYRVREMSLSRAQPERTLNLLDRALTTYRQNAHGKSLALRQMEESMAALTANDSAARVKLAADIERASKEWDETQAQLRRLHKDQCDGEEALRKLEDELETQREKDRQAQEERKKNAAQVDENDKQFQTFNMRTAAAGFDSESVNALKDEIKRVQTVLKKNKDSFVSMTETINKDLRLVGDHVLEEFSHLSGISAQKLNQNEREKLINLDKSLSGRVFGQDHAVAKLADAVRVARMGLKDPHKPQASFMLLGPSGVGKTEMAKALAAAMHDDERALLRFDMSEYMEKHAVAKLIGAPPGYEGYEAGGILTNAIRRNPYVIILFDEIEKAHPDVFNVFLQVLDDGRLTDNRGLTVSFSEAIIIMTTNIGQRNFLDTSMSYNEAVDETMKELDSVYRPEFLNRFNGRQNIVCFNALDLPVIQRIAAREIDKLNAQIKAQSKNLRIEIAEKSLAALCRDNYNPANGARGIAGFFAAKIHPAVARTLLESAEPSGVMEVTYDETSKALKVLIPRAEKTKIVRSGTDNG